MFFQTLFQAAHLVALADPVSNAGCARLVDQSQFTNASNAIREACDGLLNANATEQQVNCEFVLIYSKTLIYVRS